MTFELAELVGTHTTLELREEDPETFGPGHLVLYAEDAHRFAITERTDKPAGEDTRDVIGWAWSEQQRGAEGLWACPVKTTTIPTSTDNITTLRYPFRGETASGILT
ncbi:hypothetical protein [Microbacterium sp. NPDC055683]